MSVDRPSASTFIRVVELLHVQACSQTCRTRIQYQVSHNALDEYLVRCALLCESHVDGTPTVDGNIDIRVAFDSALSAAKRLDHRVALTAALLETLGSDSINIADLNRAAYRSDRKQRVSVQREFQTVINTSIDIAGGCCPAQQISYHRRRTFLFEAGQTHSAISTEARSWTHTPPVQVKREIGQVHSTVSSEAGD